MKGANQSIMDGNISQNEIKDVFIEVLTKLLIELNFRERKIGKTVYVKKTDCYKDLIKLFKECI